VAVPSPNLVEFDFAGLTTELEAANALHYENADITYSPDYSANRDDFDPPMRMFLYPKLA